MSRNRFKTLALALLMAAFLAPLSACYWYVGPGGRVGVGGRRFYVDEMHHQRVHSYYYYPDAGVYFDPWAFITGARGTFGVMTGACRAISGFMRANAGPSGPTRPGPTTCMAECPAGSPTAGTNPVARAGTPLREMRSAKCGMRNAE